MVAAVVGDHVALGSRSLGRAARYRQSLHVLGPARELDEPDESRRRFLRRHQQGDRGAGRVFELLDLPVEVRDPPDAAALPSVRGRIEYSDVTFRYKPNEPPALRNVYATIEAGEIVALVGPSGAGKTTFVNFVPRFYAAARRPRADRRHRHRDVTPLRFARRDRNRSARRAALSRIDFRKYPLRPDRASDEEVRAAARDANVDEYVRGFPDGYATQVGERGVRLSGGERQRIAIARAVLRDPRILILDEATSALDSHSEAMIEEALDRLLPGRTTMIIAHRLSTVRRAHKVLFIEAGASSRSERTTSCSRGAGPTLGCTRRSFHLRPLNGDGNQ